jgi:hypothetical protein
MQMMAVLPGCGGKSWCARSCPGFDADTLAVDSDASVQASRVAPTVIGRRGIMTTSERVPSKLYP